MSKYIKLEDAIRKYAEMFADEAYWEHGVGNGKPDEEDLDIAREYYADLQAIEVSEDKEIELGVMLNGSYKLGFEHGKQSVEVSKDAVSREYLFGKVYDMDNDDLVVDLKDIEDAPSVVPSRAEGEWTKTDVATYRCSECGKIQIADDVNELNFCCCCGSRNEQTHQG